MQGLSVGIVLMFAGSVALQLFGITMLPLTKGLTVLLPSLGAALGFVGAIALLARLAYSGANLSVLIPLMSAVIPLAAIAIGVLIYGESVSMLKLGAAARRLRPDRRPVTP